MKELFIKDINDLKVYVFVVIDDVDFDCVIVIVKWKFLGVVILDFLLVYFWL